MAPILLSATGPRRDHGPLWGCMPPLPSSTYQRLRHTIAERMRMSHIDQPLMLMELLGHGLARQEAALPRRRTWPGGSWGRT